MNWELLPRKTESFLPHSPSLSVSHLSKTVLGKKVYKLDFEDLEIFFSFLRKKKRFLIDICSKKTFYTLKYWKHYKGLWSETG